MSYVESEGDLVCDNCCAYCDETGQAELRDNLVEVGGEYYRDDSDAIVYDYSDSRWILAEDSCYIEGSGETTHIDNAVWCEHGEEWVYESDARQCVDGEHAPEWHADLIEFEGQYYIDGVHDEELADAKQQELETVGA